MAQRHHEIDALRGVAIYLMVLYHIAFDLQFFYDWNINLQSIGWEAVRILTVSLFLFVSGVSANFSSRPLRKALIVLGCAGLISVVTYSIDPATWIRFGILHCIGTGMLLLIVLKRLREINILFGLMIIANYQFSIINFQIIPPHQSLDFYPFFPWFGLMLIGQGLGYYLYTRKLKSLKKLTILESTCIQFLIVPSKYALPIYLIHQPVILIILWFLVQSA